MESLQPTKAIRNPAVAGLRIAQPLSKGTNKNYITNRST